MSEKVIALPPRWELVACSKGHPLPRPAGSSSVCRCGEAVPAGSTSGIFLALNLDDQDVARFREEWRRKLEGPAPAVWPLPWTICADEMPADQERPS